VSYEIKRTPSGDIAREVFNWLFNNGEDARGSVARNFVDHVGDHHLATGRDAFIELSRELKNAFTVRASTRTLGRESAMSEVTFHRRNKVVGSAVWLWQVKDGQVVARWMYGEGVVGAGWRDRISAFWQDMRRARAAIIVAVLFSFAILSTQAMEIIRMGGSDADYSLLLDSIYWTIGFSVVLAAFAILAISIANEHPLFARGTRTARAWIAPVSSRRLGVPLLLAATPFVVVGAAIWFARADVSDSGVRDHFAFYGTIYLAIGAVVIAFALLALIAPSEEMNGRTVRRAALSVGGVLLVGFVLALIWPNDGLRTAPAVTAFSLSLILGILALIAMLADRLRLPLLGAIGVFLLVSSYWGWTDHHVIRSRPLSYVPPDVGKAFADWLAAAQRPTQAPPQGAPLQPPQGAPQAAPQSPPGPTPVVLVTAEGGGIRAAVMTAMVLDELRGRAPRFARSLFAVVGVSGGSVGAAAYAVAVHQGAPAVRVAAVQRAPAASGWQNSLGADLLSPTMQSLLGLDLLGRFVPNWLADMSSWSRGRALESAWTDAWRAATGQSIERLYFEQLRPQPGGSQPALVLLTTGAGTGERMAVSHLRFPAIDHAVRPQPVPPRLQVEATKPALRILADELRRYPPCEAIDVPVATAAFMSARFPVISPAARLPCADPPQHFVDGGYFENSGVSTVFDIIQAIRVAALGKAKIIVIRIENGEVEEEAKTGDSSIGFGDIKAPVLALYGTRVAHADRATAALDAAARLSTDCAPAASCVRIQQAVFKLQTAQVPLPLGWFITRQARAEIARQLQNTHNEAQFALVARELQ
jgi:hypothetical protein